MDKTTKIALIIIGSIIVICTCSAGLLFATDLYYQAPYPKDPLQ